MCVSLTAFIHQLIEKVTNYRKNVSLLTLLGNIKIDSFSLKMFLIKLFHIDNIIILYSYIIEKLRFSLKL